MPVTSSNNSSGFSVLRVMSLATPLLVIAAIVVQFTDAYRAVPLGDLSIFDAHISEAMTYVPGVPSA